MTLPNTFHGLANPYNSWKFVQKTKRISISHYLIWPYDVCAVVPCFRPSRNCHRWLHEKQDDSCCLVTCSSRFAARYRFFDLTEERDLKMWRLKKLRYPGMTPVNHYHYHRNSMNFFQIVSSTGCCPTHFTSPHFSRLQVVAKSQDTAPSLEETSCFETSQQQDKTLEKLCSSKWESSPNRVENSKNIWNHDLATPFKQWKMMHFSCLRLKNSRESMYIVTLSPTTLWREKFGPQNPST